MHATRSRLFESMQLSELFNGDFFHVSANSIGRVLQPCSILVYFEGRHSTCNRADCGLVYKPLAPVSTGPRRQCQRFALN